MDNKDLHDFQHELIENDSFIQWVKSEFVTDDEYWLSFIDEHLDQMDDINAAIRIVSALNFRSTPTIDKEQLWKRISSTNNLGPISKPAKVIQLRYLYGLLAVACLVALFVFVPGTETITNVETNAAQQLVATLPDGSSAKLSAGTKISFDEKNWQTQRVVNLDGLAFFKVTKGSTFTVKTDQGDVTVLGTSFSVNSRNDRFEVICMTGKVSVKNNLGDEVILHPRDKVSLELGKFITRSYPEGTVDLIPWLNGGFTFENADYFDVITELENQYDVKVRIDTTYYKQKYSGFFKTGHLNDALFSITWPLKLEYKIEGKEVYITK